jgi:hypothetical protein
MSAGFIGFSWVLSSESGLINGLHGIKQAKVFSAFLPWRSKRRNGRPRSWRAEAQDCSWGKLTLASDFLQEIAVRDCRPSRSPFGRLNPKSNSLWVGHRAIAAVWPAAGSANSQLRQSYLPFELNRTEVAGGRVRASRMPHRTRAGYVEEVFRKA